MLLFRTERVEDTHTNQSTAQRRDTSLTGALMALSTRIMRTRAALGTEALATLAAVEVSLERSRVSSEQIKTYTGETIL